MSACCLGGGDYLFIRGVGLAERYILADGAVLYPGILEHHAEMVSETVACDVIYILAVNLYAAAVNVVEAEQEIDKRSLAASCRTDNGYCLAGRGEEIEAVDELFALVI